MKLNLQNWDRKPVKFYCDGIEYNHVVEADDVEGYLEAIDTGGNGRPFFDENHEVATKRIYGRVLIEYQKETKANEVPNRK